MSEARAIFVDGAAGRLHLTDYGGNGPIILALHGVTGGAFLWSGIARELTGRARIIALDFRGHGRSDWAPDRGYDTAHHVADLKLVFDQIGFALDQLRRDLHDLTEIAKETSTPHKRTATVQ